MTIGIRRLAKSLITEPAKTALHMILAGPVAEVGGRASAEPLPVSALPLPLSRSPALPLCTPPRPISLSPFLSPPPPPTHPPHSTPLCTHCCLPPSAPLCALVCRRTSCGRDLRRRRGASVRPSAHASAWSKSSCDLSRPSSSTTSTSPRQHGTPWEATPTRRVASPHPNLLQSRTQPWLPAPNPTPTPNSRPAPNSRPRPQTRTRTQARARDPGSLRAEETEP